MMSFVREAWMMVLATMVLVVGARLAVAQGIAIEAFEPGSSGRINEIRCNGATPGSRVVFAGGSRRGVRSVPGCPGLDVQLAGIRRFGSAVADGDGVAAIDFFVPNRFAGESFLVQAVEVDGCRATPPFLVSLTDAVPDLVSVLRGQSSATWRTSLMQLAATPIDATGNCSALDRDGTLWIGTQDGRLLHVDPSGEGTILADLAVPAPSIRDIALASDGTIWVADSMNARVLQLDSTGAVLSSFASVYESVVTLAVSRDDDVAEGYRVWFAGYTNATALAEVCRAAPSTGKDLTIPYTNARIRGIATDANGTVWVPVEVGGSNSRDVLDAYGPDGARISRTEVDVLGTLMNDATVTADDGHVWCVAGDGAGSSDPAYVFEFDSNGVLLQSINVGGRAQPLTCAVDSEGKVWVTLAADAEFFVLPRDGRSPIRVPVGSLNANDGDPAGYVLAYRVYPEEDFDGDGIPNLEEVEARTNPFRP